MAFSELGLDEGFFSLPPFKTYLMQLHHHRMIERDWEQTRQIVAMVHNTAQGVKQRITLQQVIGLSFDQKSQYPEWTPEAANELIEKWKDLPKN